MLKPESMKMVLVLFLLLILFAIYINDVRKERFVVKWNQTPPKQYVSQAYTKMCVSNCVHKLNGGFIVWNNCDQVCGPITKDDIKVAIREYKGQYFQ